jgi:hypothetical protein
MNIKENNKLLAEFMGCYQNNEGFWGFENTPNHKTWNNDRFLDCTKYDTDWNWLMQVVEKIESLGYRTLTENECFMITKYKLDSFEVRSKDDYSTIFSDRYGINHHWDSKMNNVYNACVSFVKWYNNQNK